MSDKKRLVVLISGRGSNMAAIIAACAEEIINGDVVGVISNKASAAGLEVARKANIETAVVDHKAFKSREAFDLALLEKTLGFQPDFVILAGFMRILTPCFVGPLIGKLVNIHPSLLPKYPGLDTHRRAIEAGDKESGATVHFVTEELDGGPAIIQVRVPIMANDSEDNLATRILGKEHQMYIEAVRLLCADRIKLDSQGLVCLDDTPLPPSGIIFSEQSSR